ncbi:MAG: ATP-binding protein, partial [Candidatus Accumulibacter sp.]|nr:ATP-binding protein [Accumulibacter sp.]
MNSFWNSCLSQFEQELSPQQFNTWIRPLRVEPADAPSEGLRLVAPNSFIQKWVRERYLERIEMLASQYFSNPIGVSLSVGLREINQTAAPKSPKTVPSTSNPGTTDDVIAKIHSIDAYEKTHLIRSFTFDNLVVGKANDLARAAALHVTSNPGGSTYNPLFIYGGAGLGKTHLIHAIGNHIATHNPGKVVRYVHAEDYYSSVVRAYQTKSFDAFKLYYRSLDVLLLDDVQFFNGKNRTQEEFFFVFNNLIETKKQIVITCDT